MKACGRVDAYIHVFLTSALFGGEMSASRLCRFAPRYPLDRKLGGPQSRSERYGEVKILDPIGTRTRTPQSFQLVDSRYTDYTMLKLY
jgi:hypothetical protein